MAQALRIYYCGIDERYFRRLQEELGDKYPKIVTFSFKQCGSAAFNNSQVLLKQLIEFAPDIVYFDFSGKFDDVLKIATLYNRLRIVKDVVKVGLFSTSEYDQMIQSGIYIGMQAYYLKKGEEAEDAIYSALSLSIPKLVVKPNFFNKSIMRGLPVTVSEVVRIGYITDEGIRVETSLPLIEGEPIKIAHSFPEEHVPSQDCLIMKTETGPLYYPANAAGILNFEFVDNIVKPERTLNKVDLAHFNDKMALREEEVAKCRLNFAEWKATLEEESRPKRVKMVIIDPSLVTMDSYDTLLWDSIFSFRIQVQAYEGSEELNRFQPNFIALEFGKADFLSSWELPEPEEGEEPKKVEEADVKVIPEVNEESIGKLIEAIKTVPGLSPFILVFSCSNLSSEEARTKFNYPKIITHKDPISTQKIVEISKVFDKKGQFFQEQSSGKVYLSKANLLSFALRPLEIKIVNITEFDLYFESSIEVPIGTLFKATEPSAFYFTTAPVDETSPFKSQGNVYKGLIHSENRDELNALRKYVIKKD